MQQRRTHNMFVVAIRTHCRLAGVWPRLIDDEVPYLIQRHEQFMDTISKDYNSIIDWVPRQ